VLKVAAGAALADLPMAYMAANHAQHPYAPLADRWTVGGGCVAVSAWAMRWWWEDLKAGPSDQERPFSSHLRPPTA
jgi:hypothetical protein